MTNPFTNENEIILATFSSGAEQWVHEAQVRSYDTAAQCLADNDDFDDCDSVVCFDISTGKARDVAMQLTIAYCDSREPSQYLLANWMDEDAYWECQNEGNSANIDPQEHSTHHVINGHAA